MDELENESDDSNVFVSSTSGPERYAAFFDEDEHGAYLYVSDQETEEIVRALQIYEQAGVLGVQEEDVQVLWSSDGTKCGVVIWGGMRGIINVSNGQELSVPLIRRDSSAVTDAKWLDGFDEYLDQSQFIRARQRYWKETLKEHEPSAEPSPESDTPALTNFVIYSSGPNKTFAVFEDDGESGYLYLYSVAEQTALRFVHVYDRSSKINVAPQDVEVKWATGNIKCGVAIWGKMRGIIDLNGGEGRVWLEGRDTPGIGDRKWLEGF